jgi:GH35 family endo-1,4-beta-xylanase
MSFGESFENDETFAKTLHMASTTLIDYDKNVYINDYSNQPTPWSRVLVMTIATQLRKSSHTSDIP